MAKLFSHDFFVLAVFVRCILPPYVIPYVHEYCLEMRNIMIDRELPALAHCNGGSPDPTAGSLRQKLEYDSLYESPSNKFVVSFFVSAHLSWPLAAANIERIRHDRSQCHLVVSSSCVRIPRRYMPT